MTREELEGIMGDEPKIQASFEVIGDDVKFIKLIVNGKEKVVSIEELEKTLPEPCEDCISRAELLKAVDTWDKFGCDANNKLVRIKDCYVPYIRYDDVVKAIKGMPSIQPKPKTDTWSIKEVADALEKHGLIKGMSKISETEIKSMTKEQNYMCGYEDGKKDVLDEIVAKIDLKISKYSHFSNSNTANGLEMAKEIINEYRKETE
jgi:hypothetical protein